MGSTPALGGELNWGVCRFLCCQSSQGNVPECGVEKGYVQSALVTWKHQPQDTRVKSVPLAKAMPHLLKWTTKQAHTFKNFQGNAFPIGYILP